ncbi:MAG: restriction endonuclease subunit S [Flavobacteriales bacterium]|nr:restriction endonuclease subunit S [Flavobacteriales bacterium]
MAYFTGPSDLTNSVEQLTKWTKIVGNTGLKGDILLTVKGSGVGTLLHLVLDEAALGRQLMAIKSKRHSTGFLFQRLILLRPYFEALASGNMIPGLSRPDILTTKVYFPALPEQQKIAAFLGAVDRKIQQLKRKQALLEQYKKGVVTALFSRTLRFKRKDGGEFPEWEEKKLEEVATLSRGRFSPRPRNIRGITGEQFHSSKQMMS